MSGDLIAQRPLSQEEQGLRYLHKIEKNGAYLRAAGSENWAWDPPCM